MNIQANIDDASRNAKKGLSTIFIIAGALMALPLPILLLLKHFASPSRTFRPELSLVLGSVAGEVILFLPFLIIFVLVGWAMQAGEERGQKLKDVGTIVLRFAPVFAVEVMNIMFSFRHTSLYVTFAMGAAVLIYGAALFIRDRRAALS